MVGRFLDRFYLAAIGCVSLLTTWLNYRAEAMQGIMPYYWDFARVIKAGFDPAAATHGAPTFPMWGYGWLLLAFGEHKPALLLFQDALALVAVWVVIRHVTRHSGWSPTAVRVLKVLLIVALPWHALHAVLWPYSIAVSLALISFAVFDAGLIRGARPLRAAALAGLLFGVMLNFRSDYVLLLPGLAVLLVALAADRRRVAIYTLLFVTCAYLSLVPWAAFTKRATGHFLITSTNGGAVFMGGLGNLPGNAWGITPVDGDPTIATMLADHFGGPHSSLTYDADRFLKKEFVRLVRERPGEYARKVAYASVSHLVEGVYPGELFEASVCQPECLAVYHDMRARLVRGDLAAAVEQPEMAARTLLQVYSNLFGRVAQLLSYLVLPLTALSALRGRQTFILLFLTAVLYQATLSALAAQMPAHSSNAFFYHLANLSFAAALLAPHMRATSSAQMPAAERRDAVRA